MVTTALRAILLVVVSVAPAVAGPDEPMVWPVVRYGWPEKLSVGLAIQPPLPRRWGLLLGTIAAGRGGMKGGAGIGTFGGNEMLGAALQLTVLHTGDHPVGAPPHATYLGGEAEFMFGNISFKAGPAFRVGDVSDVSRRMRFNFGVGYGF
jgi:hypothetical protein